MSPSEDPLIETGRFIAHPWYCDANGHLNTRFIQGFFDDATQHLLASCGHVAPLAGSGIGVVDVRCAMDYVAEIAPGSLLTVASGFKALGSKSFTSIHEMRSADGASVYARCETVSVFFDLAARKSAAMAESFRAKASRRLVASAASPILATNQPEGSK